MFTAAAEQRNSLVSLFLSLGRDDITVDSTDWEGQTALVYAMRRGHDSTVRLLLDKGANLDRRDSPGWTMLYTAAGQNLQLMVKLLLSLDVTVDEKVGASTPLYSAAYNGLESIVSLLLSHGANIDGRNANGQTALHISILGGHESVVRCLINNGAGIETRCDAGWTPFHCGAYSGHITILDLLLSKGADIYAKTACRESALLLAVTAAHSAVAKWLLNKGMIPENEDSLEWNVGTPLLSMTTQIYLLQCELFSSSSRLFYSLNVK